jgi:hypothetical protein
MHEKSLAFPSKKGKCLLGERNFSCKPRSNRPHEDASDTSTQPRARASYDSCNVPLRRQPSRLLHPRRST